MYPNPDANGSIAPKARLYLRAMIGCPLRIFRSSHAKTKNYTRHSPQSASVRLISIESILKDHSFILASLQGRVEALHGLVERLDVRVGRLVQEYTMITAALRRLEMRFDPLEAQRLDARITELESRVTALEAAKS